MNAHDESTQKRLNELLDHLKNRGYSYKNIEQGLSASKAISIDQLAEYKVRQSIERQHLCIHIILTLVVSYTSFVYNKWSRSSSRRFCVLSSFEQIHLTRNDWLYEILPALFIITTISLFIFMIRHSYYPNFGGLLHIIRVQLKHTLVFPNYFPSLR
jgi:hypothetical protein